MELVCIRNVHKKTWTRLKAEAASHEMTMGGFLSHLLEEHQRIPTKEKKNVWKKFFEHRPSLTKAEVRLLEETTQELRKDVHLREWL